MERAQVDYTIRRGEIWLENNKQTFHAETENGISFKDNFADLLILELSKRWDYVDIRIPEGRWNYFAVKPVIVPEDYPNDNDTCAVAFSILKPIESRAHKYLDEIKGCENSDGIIQVHLDPNRPRIAPEVSANIVTLFYIYGRGAEVKASLEYLEQALALESYEQSRYYFLPEPLFYYTWRLLCIASGSQVETVNLSRLPDELRTLYKHLSRRVEARIGHDGNNPLCPAVRLLICQSLGIENHSDLSALLALQESDGSFGPAWYVRYGSVGIRISHSGMATVLAVTALKRISLFGTGKEVSDKGVVNRTLNGTTVMATRIPSEPAISERLSPADLVISKHSTTVNPLEINNKCLKDGPEENGILETTK